MISLRPSLHIGTGIQVESEKCTATSTHPTPTAHHPYCTAGHESVFKVRPVQLEIRLHSPSNKMLKQNAFSSIPVFGDRDHISGSVSLDSRSCSSGRVTLSLEGTFLFSSAQGRKQTHIFFTSSQVFYTSELPSGNERKPTSFREAGGNTVRPRLFERHARAAIFSTSMRSIPFRFEMPQPSIENGQKLPPTLNITSAVEDMNQAKASMEQAEVLYTITALWEANDGSNRTIVEAPIVIQPDADLHPLDGLVLEHKSWLELPLRTDQSDMPLECAITLPNPASFSRSTPIPYFVVFKTRGRSQTLSREIAADATIMVSLLRIVNIKVSQPYTPQTSVSASMTTRSSPFGRNSRFGDGKHDARPATHSSRLKKRVKRPLPVFIKAPSLSDLGKLAASNETAFPTPPVSEIRTLQTDVCIGFPKQPRNRVSPNKNPSLDAHAPLPDGLYKSKMQLNTSMLPSIDWAGLNVNYYLDVSVLFRQDEFRSRVPIRIV